jgi:hypothetical protein
VKKNKGATAPTWTKFEEVYPSEGKLGENETMWQNRFYVVVRKYLQGTHEGAIHLSIRHIDRKAIRDWRHFQRIKNELAGESREGMEVFPPEEFLVDTANQYHLFVLPVGQTTPFTWKSQGRIVGNKNDEEVIRKMVALGLDPKDARNSVQREVEA